MEGLKGKRKHKGILTKTWERCKSFGHLQPNRSSSSSSFMVKSKSLSYLPKPSPEKTRRVVGPRHGCFSIYVGPEKQRFVIKIECTKHPLFIMLLEEAELEYGYHTDHGPLVLPCDVDCFIRVLTEMDGGDDGDDEDDKINGSQIGCTFPKSHSSYNLLTSPKLLV